MDATQSIPDLVAIAQSEASARAADMLKGNADAITAVEALAIDIFAVFEARMQHHFKRGPFSRKLKAQLLAAGEDDLAERLHQYYLAINVLKHGKGASHRELLAASNGLFTLRAPDDAAGDGSVLGLVDVSSTGFFDGLCATLLQAYRFLETG